MNATEELRKLLDDRGIKWRSKHGRKTMWSVDNAAGFTTYFSAWETDGTLTLCMDDIPCCTPELIIAAMEAIT